MSKYIVPVLTGLIVLSINPMELAAQHSPTPVLNPKTYTSASGEYRLEVDPSTIYGQGKGRHVLIRGDKEVWARTLPFTLWDAAVTDDGVVAGYAYTNGPHDLVPEEGRGNLHKSAWPGYFHTVIIEPSGELRLNQRTKRERCRFIDCDEAFPLVAGMFIDPGNDRFVLRMADPDLNRQQEKWKVLRLSDGKLLKSLRPKESVPGAADTWHIFDARPIGKTPLVLAHWYAYDMNTQTDDARFTASRSGWRAGVATPPPRRIHRRGG